MDELKAPVSTLPTDTGIQFVWIWLGDKDNS
jgi:hypothetical protein